MWQDRMVCIRAWLEPLVKKGPYEAGAGGMQLGNHPRVPLCILVPLDRLFDGDVEVLQRCSCNPVVPEGCEAVTQGLECLSSAHNALCWLLNRCHNCGEEVA